MGWSDETFQAAFLSREADIAMEYWALWCLRGALKSNHERAWRQSIPVSILCTPLKVLKEIIEITQIDQPETAVDLAATCISESGYVLLLVAVY